MNRSNLILKLAQSSSQLTVSDVELSVRALLDTMSNELAEGGRVEVRGFGTFSVHARPPKLGRNPKTGESLQIPEKRVPHFKPGRELKKRVGIGDIE